MNIDFPALQTINDSVSLAYNTAFFEAPSIFRQFTQVTQSTGPRNLYPRLDLIGGLRQWLGDREIERLSMSSFAIDNILWEKSLGVDRVAFEDDQYGFLASAAQQLGQNAAHLPDLQIAKLITLGASTTTFDGQNFFDAAHPTYDASGSATTVANYASGSNAGWLMVDTTKVLRPFIWQERRAFNITPLFSMTDPTVFFTKEFVWGVEGRAAAGFALWQLAYYGKNQMTVANVLAARTAMAAIRRPDGTPMGIVPNLLIVPPSLYPTARAYAEDEFIPQDTISGAATLTKNPLRGLFQAVENVWMS